MEDALVTAEERGLVSGVAVLAVGVGMEVDTCGASARKRDSRSAGSILITAEEGGLAAMSVGDSWRSIDVTRVATSQAGNNAVSSSIQCRFMAPSLAFTAPILRASLQFTQRRPK